MNATHGIMHHVQGSTHKNTQDLQTHLFPGIAWFVMPQTTQQCNTIWSTAECNTYSLISNSDAPSKASSCSDADDSDSCIGDPLATSTPKRTTNEPYSKQKNNKMNCELMLTYDTPALRQTGSRNLTGQKTLPTIWGTYIKLVTKYQISAINSCWEKWAYMFNMYKNQQSRQTGSRNLMGPKTLPTIWGTDMKLVTKYQISAINSCWEKCHEKCGYMFNVYKNQLSQQTGSRNLTGPKTLLTIWYTYMTFVTKYQISAINSYWEKCDEKYLGRWKDGQR
jgi:hypothetical protein